MFWGKTLHHINNLGLCIRVHVYNTRFVYCCELAPDIISLTGGWARSDDSKQYGYFFLGREFKKKQVYILWYI